MVEQTLRRDTCSGKDWFAAKNIRMLSNDAAHVGRLTLKRIQRQHGPVVRCPVVLSSAPSLPFTPCSLLLAPCSLLLISNLRLLTSVLFSPMDIDATGKFVEAILRLARINDYEPGCHRNPEEAFRWYKIAANLRNPYA